MQKSIYKLLITLAIFGAVASCNTDDPTGDAGPPARVFLIDGQLEEPGTGNIIPWRTDAVSAQLSDMGLKLTAADGRDTLFVAVQGLDTLMYNITSMSPLSGMNRFESTDSDSTVTLYTFKADGSGGGVLNITSVDEAAKRFSGELMVEYFNPINNSDFFRLISASLNNIPYQDGTAGGDDGGGDGGGDDDDDDPEISGSISFLVDGSENSFDNISALNSGAQLGFTGNQGLFQQVPSINFTVPSDIAPGSYDVTDVEVSITYNESFSAIFVADEGTLEITTHDTENNLIEGTFNFLGRNFANQETRQITEGTFSVSYLD
jgi:hypothetical protein